MSGPKSEFDASLSAGGILYQIRTALLLALERSDDPSLTVCVEKLDDISFQKGDSPTDVFQTKYHQTRDGNLTDGSRDIWRTLRVWSNLVSRGQIDLDSVVLCLITTSVPGENHAIRLLRPDPSVRDPDAAQAALEAAGKASEDALIRTAYGAYMKLPPDDRRRLIDAVHLLDGAVGALDLGGKIARQVRYAATAEHLPAFVHRLEGWWYEQVYDHLFAEDPEPIPVIAVSQQIDEIRESLKRDNLPDHFGEAPVPESETSDDDQRQFVRQLRLIGISADRLRMAQEDFYRASAQRARWIKETLVGLGELSSYEARLVDGWKQLFVIMLDDVYDGCGDDHLRRCGADLYKWAQTVAPREAHLWVRPQFQAAYMTRGSYHMLTDTDPPRCGWHPHHMGLLKLVEQAVAGQAP